MRQAQTQRWGREGLSQQTQTLMGWVRAIANHRELPIATVLRWSHAEIEVEIARVLLATAWSRAHRHFVNETTPEADLSVMGRAVAAIYADLAAEKQREADAVNEQALEELEREE